MDLGVNECDQPSVAPMVGESRKLVADIRLEPARLGNVADARCRRISAIPLVQPWCGAGVVTPGVR
jgi:hypothetical protein